MESSARLSIPLLSAGQAQKELFHNEALQLLDLVVAAAVEDGPQNDPPVSPAEGACYLVGSAPSGEWSGQANALAGYTSAGWRFIAPVDGMIAWIKGSSQFAVFSSGAWEIGLVRGSQLLIAGTQVVGPQQGAIANPSGGTTVDAEARAAITAILSALRGHGLIAAA